MGDAGCKGIGDKNHVKHYNETCGQSRHKSGDMSVATMDEDPASRACAREVSGRMANSPAKTVSTMTAVTCLGHAVSTACGHEMFRPQGGSSFALRYAWSTPCCLECGCSRVVAGGR
jgi:hypothetical protein